MIMANLQAAVRTRAWSTTRPRELCGELNRLMCHNIATQGFTTFFYALIERHSKRLTYCNAGHNPPIVISGNTVTRLGGGGAVLGVLEGGAYDDSDIRLRSGDRLLLYTDGITESRNLHDEEFGEDRLIERIRAYKQVGTATLAESVIDGARRFSNGNFEDDLTVVSICVD